MARPKKEVEEISRIEELYEKSFSELPTGADRDAILSNFNFSKFYLDEVEGSVGMNADSQIALYHVQNILREAIDIAQIKCPRNDGLFNAFASVKASLLLFKDCLTETPKTSKKTS